jgi:2-polyprenyl-3-methyl-5-hydroxy-6-metoxy-1,4-benzoquinol methylase
MSRRERRAAVAGGKTVADGKTVAGGRATASSAPADITDLMSQAQRAYQNGRSAQAEAICKQILARDAAHMASLNLLGVINQAAGRHRLAVKMFAKAIALDDLAAPCHYNIACSYLALDERADAVAHFKTAIALGMGDKHAEEFVLRNPVVLERVRRATMQSALSVKNEDLFGPQDIAAIAKEVFVRCALETTILRSLPLELFLTNLRSALLRLANVTVIDSAKVDDDVADLFCAIAQQCFINEYVFAQSDAETQLASRLRDLLLQKLSAGSGISPLLLAAVAAYFPLHSVAAAKSLLVAKWRDCAADLLRQQVREPLEEAEDRGAIPALTTVDDGTSVKVMQQYEENPFPRWTLNPNAVLVGDMKKRAQAAGGAEQRPSQDVLIAGCGTGKHSITIAQTSPEARILAIDLSRASLAYARRKTREEGVTNIEYAQADILKLGAIDRTFDRIESAGVLHHLADPLAGWRVLLPLLRPNGTMRVGLYSEIARRSFAEARTLIAERGYRATAEDIRAFRQAIIRNRDEERWRILITTFDFYNMSGCRDLLFNVIEHRFTIPEIAAFLNENGLLFLGFELDAKIIERFQQKYPDAEALFNLDYWNAFEASNPETFIQMYLFSVCKNERAAH